MGFKNYRVNIIVRVALLVLTTLLTLYYFFFEKFYVVPVIMTVLGVFQVASLIRYLDKTNRELATFLQSIRFSEFTNTFRIDEMGGSYNE
ncbi:MAG: hypothetical protein JXQ80_09630, partial [Bacteroidales bacterium]|nr:hypothetical protein [Bacteroidales bacterium]